MHVTLHCVECTSLGRSTGNTVRQLGYTDSNQFFLECDYGHETHAVLQNPRYEVLFEIGANALVDGYYREAVTSFATSLERFFEFYIVVDLIESRLETSKIEGFIKSLKKRSEREVGAYCALYLQRRKVSPNLLPNFCIELRNDVVHNGKIPGREEAMAFGQHVLDIIHPEITYLQSAMSESSTRAIVYYMNRAWAGKVTVQTRTTVRMSTLLGSSNALGSFGNSPKLEERMKALLRFAT